jgi:hypothetical protein
VFNDLILYLKSVKKKKKNSCPDKINQRKREQKIPWGKRAKKDKSKR